ncbi:MAG: OmpA family protein [Deltaproteobacteria bacterium]|nr:OmpA family protein [Deltaproteobacteria bacterium]
MSRTIAVLAVAISVVCGCGPKYPNCEKDDHCHEGEYCVNNKCQQCRDNGDCPEGQECQGGACGEIIGYCSKSSDCAQGQICRENRCGPCLEASDCQDNKVCIDGICSEAECRSTDECPAGLSCVNYRCQPDPGLASEIGAGDCEIQTLYFDFDSSEISGTMRNTIESNYHCLTKRGGRVTLVGHCDSRGTTEYNMALGERRARVVSKVMRALGMESSSMRIISKGEEEATGHSEDGWSKDRKVEFK